MITTIEDNKQQHTCCTIQVKMNYDRSYYTIFLDGKPMENISYGSADGPAEALKIAADNFSAMHGQYAAWYAHEVDPGMEYSPDKVDEDYQTAEEDDFIFD